MEEAIPWIFRIICVVGIQKKRPLVSRYLKLTICKLGMSTGSHIHDKEITKCTVNKYSLHIIPIKACRTQQGSSAVVIKTTARLHILRDVGSQRLPFWSNPIDDWALHSLGVISPGTVGTLLDLST